MSGHSTTQPSSDVWDEGTAARYDESSASMFAPDVLEPVVERLVALAAGGPALELAIGTGRVAVPLLQRGVPVSGIELSVPMLDQLRGKVSADELPVVVGDMATATAPLDSGAGPGAFALVYLVFNTIGNLCTQDEQVACFANAARHLAPGAAFVIEVGVPSQRRWPPGGVGVPFALTEDRVGVDTWDTVDGQATSHHWWREPEGRWAYWPHHFRHVWPAELDLMARLAGMSLDSRHEDWAGTPFTLDSESHVSVWRKAPDETDVAVPTG